MQAAAQAGPVARTVHVVEQVMHCHHVRTRQPARNPKQMRDVHHVALQATHDGTKLETSLQRALAVGQRDCLKSGGKGATLVHFGGEANQEILAFAIQTSQCPDHVADISADPESRHTTDVDGYFHEGNLNTEGAEGTAISGLGFTLRTSRTKIAKKSLTRKVRDISGLNDGEAAGSPSYHPTPSRHRPRARDRLRPALRGIGEERDC